MIQKIWKTGYVALIALLCLCIAVPALGEDMAASDPVGFTVKAILPENQLGDGGYFQLLVNPGVRQVIEVEIANHRDTPLIVDISVHDASTNANGLIAYGEDAASKQSPSVSSMTALRLDMLAGNEGLLSSEDNMITIAPGAVVRVPLEITMTDVPLVGQLLGGIVVTKLDDEQPGEGSFAVRSLYSYAIALQLQSEQDPAIAPSFSFASAQPGNIAGWNALVVTIENNAPLVVTGAQLSLRVYRQGETEPVMEAEKERIAMAPHTAMPYTLALPEGVTLAPGAYTVQIDWTYNGQTTPMEAVMQIPEA